MKPGSKDRKCQVLITGLELEELQRFVWMMAESFGLDSRIAAYQGKRPIGLYRWDFDCLLDVVEIALKDPKYYPSQDSPKYLALKNLQARLQQESDAAYEEAGFGRRE